MDHAMAQLAMVVHDMDEAAKRFGKLFGVEPPTHKVFGGPDSKMVYRGEPTDAKAKLAFIDMGQVKLELIEPVGGPSIWLDLLEQERPAVHHVAFRTDDYDQDVAELESQGITCVQKGLMGNGKRLAYMDGLDKVGLIIELLENT